MTPSRSFSFDDSIRRQSLRGLSLVSLLTLGLMMSGCSGFSDAITRASKGEPLWPSGGADTAAQEQVPNEQVPNEQVPNEQAQNEQAETTTPAVSASLATSEPAAREPDTVAQDTALETATAQMVADATVREGQQRTAVGEHVSQLSQTVDQLRANVQARRQTLTTIEGAGIQRAAAFYTHMAAMNTKLRTGTTPGNPLMTNRITQAQAVLDSVTNDVTTLKTLYGEVSSDNSLAAYLSASLTSAYSLFGAVDADHARIDQLKDDISRIVVDLDRLLNEITDEIARQSTYLSVEQDNLRILRVAIDSGELYGGSLRTAAMAGDRVRTAQQISSAADLRNRTPFVTLRFEGADIDYQGALYNAARQALSNNPNTIFDIVAVSTNIGDTAFTSRQAGVALTRAQEVLRSMVGFGLPANQMTLSDAKSSATATNEVRIFIR
ncbi:MAG: hypothetical protein AAF442_08365 [Pseudomonadota bacterium]